MDPNIEGIGSKSGTDPRMDPIPDQVLIGFRGRGKSRDYGIEEKEGFIRRHAESVFRIDRLVYKFLNLVG